MIGLKPELLENHQRQDKKLVYSLNIRVERLAFFHPVFPQYLECIDNQHSLGADCYTVYPLDNEGKRVLKDNPFEYLIYFEKSIGATHLESKNQMDLYKNSPLGDSIFVKKDFLGISRPIQVHFLIYDPKPLIVLFDIFYSKNNIKRRIFVTI